MLVNNLFDDFCFRQKMGNEMDIFFSLKDLSFIYIYILTVV